MGFKNTPNIGKVLEMELINAGIEDENELNRIGAEKSFELIRRHKPDACIDMLYALEGAVRGIRWHASDKNRKNELKLFFEKLNKMKTMFTLLSLIVLAFINVAELRAFEPYLRNKIVIEDDSNPNGPGGRFDGIHFGIDTAATNGLDTALGEQELFPQHPPSGVHAVFQIPNEQTGGLIWSYYDLRPVPVEDKFIVTHTINVQRPVLGSITMYWEEFPKDMLDSAILSDNIIGTIYRIDMLANKSATVKNEGLSKFEIKLYYDKNKTSVNESDEIRVSIYPNPASDRLNISGENISSVSLFDIRGEEQFSGDELSGNRDLNFDLSRLSTGIYILKILDNKGTYTFKKIIKE